MKTLFTIAFFAAALAVSAQLVTNQPSRLKFKIVCFEGKTNSSVSASIVCPSPDAIMPGSGGANTVTSPGHESDLRWTFMGRNHGNDVYEVTFTRMPYSHSITKETAIKEVQFSGKRIVVFQDDRHTVIMDSPAAADLKTR